ncbi:MAG TPA: FecR domain-containing protein [Candidatus Methylomirabilis sp.]|nr:FecR domain-containing protein [Candidatus Methylomirabilis sp.]HSB79181.1 FecR domain-containing protein [Candidatus Methylomirabilis sp.]
MRQGVSLLTPLLLLLLVDPVMSSEGQVIGVIKTVKATASVIRGQQTIPATIGTRLYLNDTLQTGADSSLGLIFRDDSVLSMGPNSRVILDQFLFSPVEGKLGFLIKIMHGTIAYLSGVIGKLSPSNAKFDTPVATIGIRGTHFAVKVQGDRGHAGSTP